MSNNIVFGLFKIGLLVGQTYYETVTEEHVLSVSEARELVDYWIDSGKMDEWMSDPEMVEAEEIITAQLESGLISTPPNPVTEVMRQIKKGAGHDDLAKAIEGISAEITSEVETTISYDDAAEIIADMEEKKLITKEGKMTDAMIRQLEAGTLDLSERHSQAKQTAILNIAQRANTKAVVNDDSKEVRVTLK